MRRALAALVLFCAVAACASEAGASEPFYGLWRTPVDGGGLVRLEPLGPDRLGDGRVYNPEDGNTYAGSITLLRDGRLRLTGCVVWPLCRTQIWRRA